MNLYHPETLEDYDFELEQSASSVARQKKLKKIQEKLTADLAAGKRVDFSNTAPLRVFRVNVRNELVEVVAAPNDLVV